MKRLIGAEYKKIFFLKSSRRYLVGVVLASPAFGLLLSLTTQATTGRSFQALGAYDVLSMNLLGVDLASLMLIAFTALSIYREFTTNLIQVTLCLTPDRKRVFLAKLFTYFGLSCAIGLITASFAYLASQLLLIFHDLPRLSPLEGETLRMLAGVTAMPIFYTLLTAAAVFLFWSSASAITYALIVLASQALAGLFPNGIRAVVLPSRLKLPFTI
jgi:ABC-2 type transport system permease protein